MIQFVNNTPGFKLANKTIIVNWLKKVAQTEEKTISNLQFTFCSDNEILAINNTYLKHNYYTDIITFDYSQNNVLSGEIFISIETVQSNAELFHVKPTEELHRVLVHGLLHLMGYKDKTKAQATEMRNKENYFLAQLNPLLTKQPKAPVSRETVKKTNKKK
jgi:probable rRNA maturation factor